MHSHVKRGLKTGQRVALLAATAAYKAASWAALMALCGKLPTEIMVTARGMIEERGFELNEEGVAKDESYRMVKQLEKELIENEWNEREEECGEVEFDGKRGILYEKSAESLRCRRLNGRDFERISRTVVAYGARIWREFNRRTHLYGRMRSRYGSANKSR